MGAAEAPAPFSGVQLTTIEARDIADIGRGFDVLSRTSIDGLIVMPDPVTLVHPNRIVALLFAALHESAP